MGKIDSFEEMAVWQKARVLCKEIHGINNIGSFTKDYSLKDQINRSSGSIMDNIAEGFERGGVKEFIQFLFIAKGSAAEVRSQLYRALDKRHISQEEFAALVEDVLSISKQIGGFINYLKRTDLKGDKYVQEPEVYYEPKILNFES